MNLRLLPAIALVLTAFHPIFKAPVSAAGQRPPNVLIIISDDHAWTDYSFMGHPRIRTPHLDRLAAQSATFTRGYVPSSLCCPSLASIITGQYAHQHKVTSNDPPLPAGKTAAAARKDPVYKQQREEMSRFIEDAPTLPRLLAQKDYLSFQTGKWWQGHFSKGGFTHGMTHGDAEKGGRHGDEGLKIGREGLQPIYDFVETATSADKPFFVWYAPFLPHTPHNPPERLLSKHADTAPTLRIAKYWAMVEWFDETCGELLDFLDRKDLSKDTIVIYVTDNGWIQDPNSDQYAPKSKQSQYDGGLRTPIMVRWPAKITPEQSGLLVNAIDIAPTVLTAAGIHPPEDMPGVNLLDRRVLKKRKAIFGECFTHNAVDIHTPASSLRWRWVIESDWKLIVPSKQNEPDGVVELFNLKRDPFEENNLATKEPKRVRNLQRLLDSWWPGTM